MTQQSRADLQTTINTNVNDNTSGDISPADVRTTLTNQNDSAFNKTTDDADDVDSTSSTNKFTTASDISKLAGIETGAEVNTIDTVSDTSEIDLVITARDLTASIVASSIDESKLDSSVNASLDLADSALQPADIASGTITARADDINFSGGSDGDVLTVQADGSLALETPSGAGTVTSIATTGPISGGTITSTGTITTSMATNKLIGRGTAGTGVMEEITLGTNLSLSGTTLNAAGGGGGGTLVYRRTWSPTNSNTATDQSYSTSGTANGGSVDVDAANVYVAPRLGSTATDGLGQVYIRMIDSSFSDNFSNGGIDWTDYEFKVDFVAKFELRALGTETSISAWGLAPSTILGEAGFSASTNFACFFIEYDTDGFYLKARTASDTGTIQNTTIQAVSIDVLTTFFLTINASSTSVKFYVNGILEATHTGDIPNDTFPYNTMSCAVSANAANNEGDQVFLGSTNYEIYLV